MILFASAALAKLTGADAPTQIVTLNLFTLKQPLQSSSYLSMVQWRQKISILSSREERPFLYFNHLSKEFLEQMIPHLKALILGV